MDLIPHDELRPSPNFNFAPMIDFLFLMLALFATLAISKAALYDSEIQLVSLSSEAKSPSIRPAQDRTQVHLSINALGAYKWMTEFQEYPMGTIQEIQEELSRQYQTGVLPKDKSATEVLLHIDQKASWDVIVNLIFAIREIGFTAHPVYENRS